MLEVQAADQLEHRDVDDDQHDRVDALAQQPLDDRADRLAVVGRGADRLDVVAGGARREVEVHRDRRRARSPRCPGVTSPMVRVRRVTSARAAGEGLYCSCAIACSTRARVAGRTFGQVVDAPARRSGARRPPGARRRRCSRSRPRAALLAGSPPHSSNVVRSGHQGRQRVDGELVGRHGVDDPAVRA